MPFFMQTYAAYYFEHQNHKEIVPILLTDENKVGFMHVFSIISLY